MSEDYPVDQDIFLFPFSLDNEADVNIWTGLQKHIMPIVWVLTWCKQSEKGWVFVVTENRLLLSAVTFLCFTLILRLQIYKSPLITECDRRRPPPYNLYDWWRIVRTCVQMCCCCGGSSLSSSVVSDPPGLWCGGLGCVGGLPGDKKSPRSIFGPASAAPGQLSMSL